MVALAVLVLLAPLGARAEIAPAPEVPTLGSIEWTVGPAVLGIQPADPRLQVVLGMAVPVVRVGSESMLFVGLETAAPVWTSGTVGIPLLGKGYVRLRLSDASGLRFGIATGVDVALKNVVDPLGVLVLGTAAFDLHFTKHTRIVLEPQAGLAYSSSVGTSFAWFPRVSVGFSF